MTLSNRILDTNILIHANGDQSPQTSAACKEACLKLLFSAMAGDYQLVLDGGADPNGSDILAEYRNKLHEAGGGFGEMFLRWVLQNWQNHRLIPITRDGDSYKEFPQDPALKDFDLRDHKWIATAAMCYEYEAIQPEIMQSADYKWEAFVEVLAQYHVRIVFVCPNPSAKKAGR